MASDRIPEDEREDWHNAIVCPACGEIDHEYTEYPTELRHDGDSALTTCPYCDTDFTVTMCVEYSYQSRKNPGGPDAAV